MYNVEKSKIKFDYKFYKNYYSDLKAFNKNELINHYIKNGCKEKRLFCDIQENFDWLLYIIENKLDNLIYDNIYKIWQHFLYHELININKEFILLNKPNEISEIIEFNSNFYLKKYNDLNIFDTEELYIHYHEYGRNEKRIFMEVIDQFNFAFYNLIYEDLNFNTIDELWTHYIYHGIKEKRYCNFNTIINFSEKLFTENQKFVYLSILPFKIREKYKICYNVPKTAIIYVFYNRPNELKNESNLAFFIRQTVLIDKYNIYLFIINGYTCEVIFPQQKNLFVLKNYNCYDFEAYGIGINYLRCMFGQNLNSIKRIVTMNCGVTGPFYKEKHWLSEFENKLSSTNSFVCTNVIYRLNKINYNHNSNIRTPGYLNYFINDSNIINKLMKSVFIKHNTKKDCIINGEYGFAKILIQNNKNITSIIDNKVNGYKADRDNNLDKFNLYSLIFVKNNWRINEIDRDSLPIKSIECINEINKLYNFKYDSFNINYDYLYTKDFYNTYGISEELIVYPIISHKNNKLALYCHSDKDNLFKSYCIDAVNTLSCLGYKVIICTTCDKFSNINNLPYEKIVMSNAKIDTFMIKTYLNSNNISDYSHLLCVNDSIIFPIHGINNMKDTFNKFNDMDFWGIWNSPEEKEHIMSPFLHFSNKTFTYFRVILNKYLLTDFTSAQQWEINMLQEMKSQNFSTGVVVDYKTLNLKSYSCPIMHPKVFPQWIHRKEVFAIKWKYMGNYLNKEKLNIPYMNYLLRYLHFNETGLKENLK